MNFILHNWKALMERLKPAPQGSCAISYLVHQREKLEGRRHQYLNARFNQDEVAVIEAMPVCELDRVTRHEVRMAGIIHGCRWIDQLYNQMVARHTSTLIRQGKDPL